MDSSTQTDPSGRTDQVQKRAWEKFLPQRPLRVLLVEDDDATRLVVCALLCKCGYEVNPVSNGLKAWDLMECSDERFDLVLTEAAMPFLPGTDLLAKIMISDAHRDTPVIMMSSHDSLEVVFKCLLRGAKDFLVKPLRKNELRNLWQHVWRRNHASTRSRRGALTKGKKRKAARLSGTGDASSFSGDDISLNSDEIARSQSDNGSATQSFCRESSAAVKETPTLPDRDLAIQGHTVHAFEMGLVHDGRNILPGDANIRQQCSGRHGPGDRVTMSPPHCAVLSEGSEASERSAKAIDFIGTMTVDSRPGENAWKAEGEELLPGMSETSAVQNSVHVSDQPPSLPTLELTLKRPCLTEDAWCRPDAKNSVKQSDYSAFSRYTSGALFQQRQGVAIVACLSSDQCSLTEVLRSPPSGDGAATAHTAASVNVVNDRIGGNRSCGSSTLHFPRAIPFQQGRRDGNSAVRFLAPPDDCDGKQADNVTTLHCKRSPPMRLSSVNGSLLSSDNLPPESSQACTNSLQQQIYPGASPGSVWSPKQPEVFDKGVCDGSSDHFDYESQHPRHCYPQSSSSVLQPGVSKVEGENLCQKDLLSTQSGIEIAATGRTTVSGLNVSGSGSNIGSNDGSTPSLCHPLGQEGKHACTQESCSFGDFVKTDETSAVSFNGAAVSDAKVHCSMLPPEFSRVTLREAALNKFREKRKVRCFDKKVRYHSRKKLAEQRPRVKGQFVRQAVYDASLCKLEHGMVCS